MSATKPLLLLCLVVLTLFPLGANPFLSGGGNTPGEGTVTAAPPASVRPPAVRGPQQLWDLQLALKDKLAELFVPTEEASFSLRLSLLAIAFLYGFVHALGPGHRKTIIFTLFLSRKTKPWEPVAAGFLSGGAHGGTGILLILLLQLINPRNLAQRSDTLALHLEGITYLLLAALALFFLVRSIREMAEGHHHHPGGGTQGRVSRGIYATVLSASFFPCPGSILILLFSLSLGQAEWGILTVTALSLGMGVTISLTGLLARTGREGLFHRLKTREILVSRLGSLMEGGAYLFLLLFSLWMAAPFTLSLV